jgi:DNA (cytosine-5)-methyltransferase 1
MKNSYYTVTDQFCGGGGSSLGVKKAAEKLGETFGVGVEVKLAMNHWPLAIETHNTNFPNVIHDCSDASACDPRRYMSTDMLVTSPECTKHSPASGKKRNKYQSQIDLFGVATVKPEDERSRATMWDVPRFAEVHHYRHIVVENVVEAHEWVLFPSWLKTMQALGYNFKMCFLNSQFFNPCPQSRDRMYVVFWKKGMPKPNLEYKPKGFCEHCEREREAYQSWKNPQKKWGKYNREYVYRCSTCTQEITPYFSPAYTALDWSLSGERIGDRKKPLSPKTMARIQWGIDEYEGSPLIINTAYTHAGPSYGHYKFLDSFPTQTTKEIMGVLFPPLIVENQGQSMSRSVNERMACLTTAGKMGLVMDHVMHTFLSYYYSGSNQSSHMFESIGTIPTVDRIAVINRKPNIDDCYYRMLKIHEAQRAMAFPDDYKLLGTQEEKMKLLGNAVTPPAEQWIVEQCIASVI